jgi:hypothetical protein
MENNFEQTHWHHILALAIALGVEPKKFVKAAIDLKAINAYEQKMVESVMAETISVLGKFGKEVKSKKRKKAIKN